MIPTYHCAQYLEQTLRSVLDQDPGPEAMEIVVVDDHSVHDDPSQVVRHVGRGRVEFVRQDSNQGHVRTFNHCLQRSRGEVVHLLHGDDWVEPGFYAAADRAFRSGEDLAGFLCRFVYAHDASGLRQDGPQLRETPGVLDGWLEHLAVRQRVQAPSTVVRRAVYERIGGFDLGVNGYGEDWEMWLRVAAAGPVWWEPERLAAYRVRAGSLSDPSRLRSNMVDMRRVIGLNRLTLRAHLPAERADDLTRQAEELLAVSLLRRSHRALLAGDRHSPLDVVREVLTLSPKPRRLAASARLLARWGQLRLTHRDDAQR